MTSPVRKRQRLFFVEDSLTQMYGLEAQIKATGMWEIDICTTPEDAWDRLLRLSEAGLLPNVVSIDLGLADLPNEPDRGLALLEKIRKKWEGLPLVIHSNLDVEINMVRTVVAQNASYIFLRDERDAEGFVTMLPFVARGFLVYSPTPSARLAQVLNTKPNPFHDHDDYWEMMELLERGLTYGDIGDRLSVASRTIKAWVKKVALDLHDNKEIVLETEDEGSDTSSNNYHYRRAVVNWFRQNRYRRDF